MENIRKTKLFMDTVVEIQAVVHDPGRKEDAEAKIDRAFEAFRNIERACSRFSPDSEMMQALQIIGQPVAISPFLYEPLKFAWNVAEMTEGEFDPAIGRVMEEQGYNRHYLTGERMETTFAEPATFRDIVLNDHDRTLYLQKPLVIDLGAVAKGFAIDLAANELKEFEGFIVNAGGDLFAGGMSPEGRPWKIGIQDPVNKDEIIDMVEVCDEAVCTSGSYERRSAVHPDMHHIISLKTGSSPNQLVSSTVIAPFAMMADAFSTTAFLFGVEKGKELIENMNLKGLLITSDLQIVRVGGI